MTDTITLDPKDPTDLRHRFDALQHSNPKLRIRDAAAALKVSEAELLATRCGSGVVRLDKRWAELIRALPGLGPVMALTRNEHVVHEKDGRYGEISIFGTMGLVLNHEIDLRLFLDHWHFGFASEEDTKSGRRRSLQIFDADGTAVHKIYLRKESDLAAYHAIIDAHRAEDQSPALDAAPLPVPPAERPDREIDQAGLRQRWLGLADVHDFFGMLRDFRVGRQQAFRLAGSDLAYPVAPSGFCAALGWAAADGLPIMVFVGSPGVIQIHTGRINRLVEVGGWFNVLDSGFNLHLKPDGIVSAWVVRKPTNDGIVTSLEVFDADGGQIAWMFGKREAGQPERADWRALVDRLPAAAQ